MKNLLFVCILSSLLLSCSGNAPSENIYLFDSSYFSDGFHGVTLTDESGNIIGNYDADDWNLYYGRSIFAYAMTTDNNQKKDPPINAKLIPSGYDLSTAYPNPSDGVFSFEIAVPAASQILVTIADKDLNIVYQIEPYIEAGITSFTLLLNDINNPYYQRNIYRVFVDINGSITGYGDVMIIK